MATHVVADDTLGTISRRMWEVQRRLMEGTLDPSFVARNLRLTAEGKEVSSTPSLVTASPFFANEEVKSNDGYPQGYVVKPICEQLLELSRHFPGLNAISALALSKELPALPVGAEGWFAVPRWEKVAGTYNAAVEKVLNLIGKTRIFHYDYKNALGPNCLRLSKRTAVALEMLGERQKGDFLLIPAQFGLTHRGRSIRRVRVRYAPNEFGLGTFAVGIMLLTHPEREVWREQLHVNCAGDKLSSKTDGDFLLAPYFEFHNGGVWFGAIWFGCASERHGSASAFLPADSASVATSAKEATSA